jgi:hypothetical protein
MHFSPEVSGSRMPVARTRGFCSYDQVAVMRREPSTDRGRCRRVDLGAYRLFARRERGSHCAGGTELRPLRLVRATGAAVARKWTPRLIMADLTSGSSAAKR